jgi:hypothetical protein
MLWLQMLDIPAVVNAKLSQRTLRSYWSIPFTQELPGKNPSHVCILPTIIIISIGLSYQVRGVDENNGEKYY